MYYAPFSAKSISELQREAQQRGLFLPLIATTDALHQTETLHGHTVADRNVLQVSAVYDASETGAPSSATMERYQQAAAKQCGILWTEPIAICPEGRANAQQLWWSEEHLEAFQALTAAIRATAAAHNQPAPLLIASLDHAGRYALEPQILEHCPALEPATIPEGDVLADTALTQLVVRYGEAARIAEAAGFDGIALNACHRNLFSDSLAAYRRDGAFGGDFDDRTRFLRDCLTAAKLTTTTAFPCIRLNLYDGIPQPFGWGMAFEDPEAPDLSEPALLLSILRELFGVELVACEAGNPHWNPHVQCPTDATDLPEHPLTGISRLCTCTAMLDSALQQTVKLIVPNCSYLQQFAPNLGAAMIAEEYASFAACSDASY